MRKGGDGAHTLYFRSVDKARNTEEIQSISFKIDQTPPSVPTITLDPEDAWTNADAVTVTIADADDNVSGVDYTEYRTKFNNGAWSGWSKYTEPLSITAEGLTEVEAKVYDNAGNVSEVTSATVKIDRTNPRIIIGRTTYTGGETIELGYIAKGYSKVIGYTKTDDASGFAPEGDKSITTSVNIPTDVVGMGVTRELTVTDRAGNNITLTFRYHVISLDDLAKMLRPMADGGVYNRNRTIPIKIQVVDNDRNPIALSSGDIILELELKDSGGNTVDFSRTNNRPDLGHAEFVLNNDGVVGSYFRYNLNVRSTPQIPRGVYTLHIHMNTDAMSTPYSIGSVTFTLR